MKKIFKSIGLIALAVCIGLTALFIPFRSKNVINSACADNTLPNSEVTFLSSNIINGRLPYSNSASVVPGNFNDIASYFPGASIYNILQNYSFSIKYKVTGNSFSITTGVLINSGYTTNTGITYNSGVFYEEGRNIPLPMIEGQLNIKDYSYNMPVIVRNSSNSVIGNSLIGFAVDTNLMTSSNPTPSLKMKTVEISYVDYYDEANGTNFVNSYPKTNVVSYVDTTNCRYTFFIPTWSGVESSVSYDYRKYFLLNLSEFTDNDYYNQGVTDGFATGLTEGQAQGYNNGFKAGETQGYNNGYSEGVESANEYTFFSLIGAAVDAPVSVFSSLFNFELLGVNLLSFFTSLLTFCLCLWLLRLILGGK